MPKEDAFSPLKLNEITVTSYKFISSRICVRLSNQLRKILIFFLFEIKGVGSKLSEFIAPSSASKRNVGTGVEKF